MLQPEKLEYENRIIAFIDILGFKELIKESESDISRIELVNSVLNYLKELETTDKWTKEHFGLLEIEEDVQRRDSGSFSLKSRINTTSFSDCIVISVKVEKNVNEMVSALVVSLAYIGAKLLEKSILIRGGLTIGNIIHKGNGIVFGQGLIDAYTLEGKSAKFPRLVLSDKLIRQLKYPIGSKKERYPYHQYFKRFDDGTVGFHQMTFYQVHQSWIEWTDEGLVEKLNIVRKVIIRGLDSSFENPDVFEKFRWLKDQYNELIIFDDHAPSHTAGLKKLPIRNLNEDIPGNNIHYDYTDRFYEKLELENRDFLEGEE